MGYPAFPTPAQGTPATALVGPASTTVGDFALWNNTVGTLLKDATPAQVTAALDLFSSSLQGLVPASGGGTTNFLRADGTFAAPPAAPPSGFVQRNVYTSSQTITIPTGATKGFVRLVGGGGGVKSGIGAGGGGGGYLEKALTGLTAGNTLALTVGAGGAATGTAGGASSLASGTQSISTLTANGGNGQTNNGQLTAGGTATGGDINITGSYGSGFYDATNNDTIGVSGGSPLGSPGAAASDAAAGVGYGGGGAASQASATGAAGSPGVCIIDWYA